MGRGEIIGVAGLVGSGRSTLLRALFGLERGASGELTLDGRTAPLPRSVAAAIRAGIGFVPEDRKTAGLVLSLPAVDNIVLAGLGAVARRRILSASRARRAAAHAGDRLGLPASMRRQTVLHLSGGNQQKVLLARWIHRTPRVLLADEPTRGIDIGAKARIMRTLVEMAADGLSILVVSSDHEELLGIADTIVVLSHGRVAAALDNRRRGVTEQQILQAAFAVDQREEEPGVDH